MRQFVRLLGLVAALLSAAVSHAQSFDFYPVATVSDWEDYSQQITDLEFVGGPASSFEYHRPRLSGCEHAVEQWKEQVRIAKEAKAKYDHFIAKLALLEKPEETEDFAVPAMIPYPYQGFVHQSWEFDGLGRGRAGAKKCEALLPAITAALNDSYPLEYEYQNVICVASSTDYRDPSANDLRTALSTCYVACGAHNQKMRHLVREWKLRTVGILSVQQVVPQGWTTDLSYAAAQFPQWADAVENAYCLAIADGYTEKPGPVPPADGGGGNFWGGMESYSLPDPIPSSYPEDN